MSQIAEQTNFKSSYASYRMEDVDVKIQKQKVSKDTIIPIGIFKGESIRFVCKTDKHLWNFRDELKNSAIKSRYGVMHQKLIDYFERRDVRKFKQLNDGIEIITNKIDLRKFLKKNQGIAKVDIHQDSDKLIKQYEYHFYLKFVDDELHLQAYKNNCLYNYNHKPTILDDQSATKILEDLDEHKLYLAKCMRQYEAERERTFQRICEDGEEELRQYRRDNGFDSE